METIGKYQIQKVIGRGGMGTVYEALDPLINRKVAVKTMIAGLAESGDLRERFLREAQAAGGLRHRNIVTVYDLGEDKGQPFIAMEFIEGTDLEKIIQNREPLTVEWKLDVLRQVCEGLAYAHRAGIVHRDIKPANIRVTHEGEAKIMDFGIAHLQSSTMTKSGLVLGTVHYMAPEQIEGQKVDHRADVFSVGAIAYELIAYRKPFDGESLTAVMFRIMHERPDPKHLASEYSPSLDAIVMKALARDPTQRYQNLDDMAGDVAALLRESGARVPERPAGLHGTRSGTPTPAPVPDERVARVSRLVEEGQQLLAKGEPDGAVERAREALSVHPTDPGARELMRIAEGQALSHRVEREIAEIRAGMERARAEGHLQKALGFCRRLLELNPDDKGVGKIGSEIEIAIHEREVEQLCSLAVAYATEGDVELALKIAGKIERLSPRSARYLQLKKYLDEELSRKSAEALVATAQEHLVLGNLEEARAAAEEALVLNASHALAREIRDRAASVLATRSKPIAPAAPAPAAPPPPAPQPKPAVAAPAPPPAPKAPTAPAIAASSQPAPTAKAPGGKTAAHAAAPKAGASAAAAAPAPPPAAAGATAAATATPPPGTPDARRNEIEALTTAAVNAFVQNNYPKALKAVEKALALDPDNKKARELAKILGALG